MSRYLVRRLENLERWQVDEAEVTLREIVAYSYVYDVAPDLDLERRIAKSKIGRLICQSANRS
jgi:hypothetical protein